MAKLGQHTQTDFIHLDNSYGVSLSSHPTLSALQQLLSECYVSGGTFADQLPTVAEVPSSKRSDLRDSAREIATEETEQDLIEFTGLDVSTPLERVNGGPRIWPSGFTGSLTDKGTVVLGAIVELGDVRAIGIDLELNQSGGDKLEHTVLENETLPNVDGELSTLAGFSVKEAVFKAYFRVERMDLNYSDVRLTWTHTSDEIASGIAECPTGNDVNFECTIWDDWVISAASC